MHRKDYNPKVGGTYILDNPTSQFHGSTATVTGTTPKGYFNVTLSRPVGGTSTIVAFKHELAPVK